jgi:tripartite-type tricarboxylate transporter receptor subunit TctC
MLRNRWLIFFGFTLLLAPSLATAQSETRPITIVVPFTAGTGVDILARVIGDEMQSRLGQPVVIENKPGASGNIGTYQVARAASDGLTLLMTAPSHVLSNIGAFKKFPFDPQTSFAPVIEVATGALALVVHHSVPAKTLREYVELTRSKPGELNYASTGPLSAQHLAMELFKLATKTNVVHVPYPGSAGAIRDVVAGHVNAMFMPLHTALPLLPGQQIRALAVASERRSALAPDVPTIAEEGVKGADVELWYGLLAPAGTPKELLERYNKLTNEILALPKVHAELSKQGLVIVGGSARQFEDFIADEVRRWEKVIVDAGLTPNKT